jgi:hypothetical protein
MKTPTDRQLPRFVRDMLASPPHRGGGLHNWLFRTARLLHRYRNEAEIIELLRAATFDEPIKHREIEDAVKDSEAAASKPDQPAQSVRPAWPKVNAEQREAVIASGIGLADLWEDSPRRFEDNKSHTEEIISAIFPGDPLLCVGQSRSEFATKSRKEWRGKLAALQLIVPSPMTARIGLTKSGRKSAHTLDATGPRRFLVIEQDNGTIDQQSAVLLHLATLAPLALAVHSGNKSIHGWFFCEGQPEEKLRRFMRYAVTLGADSATWTRSQFVRMPGGVRRDNGKRQTIFFFNPEVLK